MKATMRSKIAVIAAVLCAGLLAGSAQAALNAYLKIEGTKQGKFKGESIKGQSDDTIAISDFNLQLASPRDVASGQTTGRRMHETFSIMKEVDRASPMFLAAKNSGEVLSAVEIDFVKPGTNGNIYKSFSAKNAMVTSIRLMPGAGAGKQMEEITFAVDNVDITLKDAKGGKSATDDWLASK